MSQLHDQQSSDAGHDGARRLVIGWQIADSSGENCQGDHGVDRYASFEVLDVAAASAYLAELNDGRAARDRYMLQPIYEGDIEEPSFARGPVLDTAGRSIVIRRDDWSVTDVTEDGRIAQMLATIEVNGTRMYLEAWAVEDRCAEGTCSGGDCRHAEQRALTYDEQFSSIYAGVSMEGAFAETEIDGRRFVLIAIPGGR